MVTIDAMGCQHAIAKQIIDHQGDYVSDVSVLTGNQDSLHEVEDFFITAQAH